MTKALLLAVVVALIAVGVAATRPSPQDAPDVRVDAGTWYVLVNGNSDKALADDGRDIAEGAPVAQWSRDDASWQRWQFVPAGDGYYRLRNQHSNKMLADGNNPFVDGGRVAQARDLDGVEQHWRLVQSGGGLVRLVNRVSGKALQVRGSSTRNGAVVDQQADRDAANQQWRLVPVGSADYPDPEPLNGDLTTHDPAVITMPGRHRYLLAGTGRGIGLKTSPDRAEWTDVGSAFPAGAPWAHRYTDPDDPDLLWAPDISRHHGVYHLYYAASRQGSFHSAIFLATSKTGKPGSWTNRGLVVETQEHDDFNAIDPNQLVDDQGRWWLAFGSYGTGIKLTRLDPATGKRLNTTMLTIADRSNDTGDRFHGPEEAAFIYQRGRYYYLYMSFDHCCAGSSSDYRVTVARSTSATGPYVDKYGFAATDGGGTEMLAGHGAIHGPGHQAVLHDRDGDVLFYHYYADGTGPTGCAYCPLGVNRIGYDAEGWPYVSLSGQLEGSRDLDLTVPPR